ncbi:FAD:protein FMN transferase [Dysgonomonas sp. 25]|uniref:FAD:protein FMN transferase n=1 Tax=Dysgonomonas sp. 25 TaxID=2302933 RepID=UPI0013D1C862|nr:FAD:protein FMN transferase [Dysgonomonas sp. 25]NDV68360.1 FAD:protein FMN transferase [Dysgonomonas sp. 25]
MRAIMADNGDFYYNICGTAEGTSYNILYQDAEGRDFQSDIASLLAGFEKSLSVYDKTSLISRINRNETTKVDAYFAEVFTRAKEIYSLTDGAFDASAEPLFKAWGFGGGARYIPDEEQIKELQSYIGMDKIRLENNQILKIDPRIVLNFNAIAKGYSADIVARFLEAEGCVNYMAEIGGEIRLKGKNLRGGDWRVGIDRPTDENLIPGQDLQVILEVSDKALATSGNYRQYYIENGQKMVHTIDPSTGYPVRHNLLSVTVVADDAITADAFATAFLVRGLDGSAGWIEKYPSIDALFICDEEGEYKVYSSAGMKNYIAEIR